jgi:TRAP-type C4-dicarboxylate transport system permease small subunit
MTFLLSLTAALDYCNRKTLALCRVTVISLVGAITAVVCAGVFWRYFLNDALSWTEETAKFLMVWLVFAGAPIALRSGANASIDALPELLPHRLRQLLFGVIYAIILCFLFVLIDQGLGFALKAKAQTTATTNVSMLYVFISMPIGAVLMFGIGLQLFMEAIAGIVRLDQGVHLSTLHDQDAVVE